MTNKKCQIKIFDFMIALILSNIFYYLYLLF